MAVERPGTLAVSELVQWWPLLTVLPVFVEVHLVSARVPLGFVVEVAVKDQRGSLAILKESHK